MSYCHSIVTDNMQCILYIYNKNQEKLYKLTGCSLLAYESPCYLNMFFLVDISMCADVTAECVTVFNVILPSVNV